MAIYWIGRSLRHKFPRLYHRGYETARRGMTKDKTVSTDEQMRREFNEWAEAGRGEEMEKPSHQHHPANAGADEAEARRARARSGLWRGLGEPPAGADGRRRRAARAGSRSGCFGRDDSPRPREFNSVSTTCCSSSARRSRSRGRKTSSTRCCPWNRFITTAIRAARSTSCSG